MLVKIQKGNPSDLSFNLTKAQWGETQDALNMANNKDHKLPAHLQWVRIWLFHFFFGLQRQWQLTRDQSLLLSWLVVRILFHTSSQTKSQPQKECKNPISSYLKMDKGSQDHRYANDFTKNPTSFLMGLQSSLSLLSPWTTIEWICSKNNSSNSSLNSFLNHPPHPVNQLPTHFYRQ